MGGLCRVNAVFILDHLARSLLQGERMRSELVEAARLVEEKLEVDRLLQASVTPKP